MLFYHIIRFINKRDSNKALLTQLGKVEGQGVDVTGVHKEDTIGVGLDILVGVERCKGCLANTAHARYASNPTII